jgi:hypothetical protein
VVAPRDTVPASTNDDLFQWQDELARIARETLRVLTNLPVDSEELAGLDARAAELRSHTIASFLRATGMMDGAGIHGCFPGG